MDINLLPWRKTQSRKTWIRFSLWWLSLLIFHIFCWILFSSVLNIRLLYWRKHHAHMYDHVSAHQRQLSQMSRYSTSVIDFLERMQVDKESIFPELMTVARALPAFCMLSEIRREHGIWRIDGVAKQVNLVFLFFNHLKHVLFFRQAVIKKLEETQSVHFIIEMKSELFRENDFIQSPY